MERSGRTIERPAQSVRNEPGAGTSDQETNCVLHGIISVDCSRRASRWVQISGLRSRCGPSTGYRLAGLVLSDRGSGAATEPPVVGIDFLDRHVGPLRRLVQHALQSFGHFLDDLSLLRGRGSFTGDADANEGHCGAPIVVLVKETRGLLSNVLAAARCVLPPQPAVLC